MSIRLSDMVAKKRSFLMTFQGDELTIVYRPNAITPSLLAELEGLNYREGLVKQVTELVSDWEVLDAHGQPIAVTPETVSQMSTRFLQEVTIAIQDDIRSPGAEEKKG